MPMHGIQSAGRSSRSTRPSAPGNPAPPPALSGMYGSVPERASATRGHSSADGLELPPPPMNELQQPMLPLPPHQPPPPPLTPQRGVPVVHPPDAYDDDEPPVIALGPPVEQKSPVASPDRPAPAWPGTNPLKYAGSCVVQSIQQSAPAPPAPAVTTSSYSPEAVRRWMAERPPQPWLSARPPLEPTMTRSVSLPATRSTPDTNAPRPPHDVPHHEDRPPAPQSST